MYYSVPTLDAPEFLNLTPYNPLISKCEIKVLYVGQNRNGSVIYKDVAEKMANTLPGSPIVGMWIENNKDFGDHGNKIVIEDGEIKTISETKPYGFVAPDAKVWFKTFEEFDARTGDLVKREYLMTEGLLWTGQYEEAKRIIEKGNNQSMELDSESLKGEWSEMDNEGYEFFIINDAVFSKLCILGENVEPCFEGATIGDLDVSKHFSLSPDFTKTLYSMMKELKGIKKGEETVENNEVLENVNVENEDFTLENPAENPAEEPETEFVENAEGAEDAAPAEGAEDGEPEGAEGEPAENFENQENVEDVNEEPAAPEFTLEDYQALEAQNAELQNTIASLNEELDALKQFKLEADRKEKQAMIDSFTVLEDTDKVEIQENIDKYSLDEIESKLCVLCVRKKVNFSLEGASENDNSLGNNQFSYIPETEHAEPSIPAWLQAVKEHNNR